MSEPEIEPCKHGPHFLSDRTCAGCGTRWTDAQIKAAINRPGGEYPGQPVDPFDYERIRAEWMLSEERCGRSAATYLEETDQYVIDCAIHG